MIEIGEHWQEIALLGKEYHNQNIGIGELTLISQKLTKIANLETNLWNQILQVITRQVH
jgi:hypothetical protein